MRARLFPHPFWSAALVLFWLWLNNTLALGHVLLGAGIGWVLPLFVRRFWPEHEPVSKPWRLLSFAALVLFDVVTANLRVARVVLGPIRRIRPGFARIPLDVRTDLGITTLMGIITLTPGTLSADLSEDRRELLVHYLDEVDETELVAGIKRRYERPIREVFG